MSAKHYVVVVASVIMQLKPKDIKALRYKKGEMKLFVDDIITDYVENLMQSVEKVLEWVIPARL